MAHSVKETWRIHLTAEVVAPDLFLGRALPALEEARDRHRPAALRRLAREVAPRLRDAPGSDRRELLLGLGRLEALEHADPEGDPAFEEVAWALLRAARLAPPVDLGTAWDLARAVVDPARRRSPGLAAPARTLAAAALTGTAPLATSSGFALARRRSYATGWNPPDRAARIARALTRWTPARIRDEVRRLPPALELHPPGASPPGRRGREAEEAVGRLREAYASARRTGAGVFLELAVEGV